MTAPSRKLLVAWALGSSLVFGSASGQAAAPAVTPTATSPKGQVTQRPSRSPPTAVLAAPAASAPVAAATTGDAAAAPAAPASAGQARATLERGLTELGDLAARARQSGDVLRIACVQDKQDRANAVMEVATGDILVAQDPAADAQTRAFAGEKLGEAAQRMQDLVNRARACTGKEEPGTSGGSNQAQVPQVVLPQDPTSPMPPAVRGLPPIDPRPPVASPVL